MKRTPTKLQRLRKQRNQTILEVARATGIDPGALSRIERGKREPGVVDAAALVRHFAPDLTLDDLAALSRRWERERKQPTDPPSRERAAAP